MKQDLLTCQEFLTGFNGKAFFVDDIFLTGDYLQLFTDASGGRRLWGDMWARVVFW